METQQLVDLGKQMNLEGEELREFVRAEQALARDERIRIREKKKEDEVRIAAMEEAERIRQHKKEDEERIRQHKKEYEERIAAMEEAERIRQHEKEMFHLQIEAEEEVQHDEVGKTADEGDGFNVELNTCADIAESAQVGHVTKDGEDASEQEAEHHKTYADDG